jgi:hypothetical protein
LIDKDKTYRTRDGREVRIYATDGHPNEPVHGAFKDNDQRWNITAWHLDGSNIYRPESYDLIEVKPRIKRTVYLHIYDDYTNVSDTPIQLRMNKPRACVKVEIDCEEGEGL